MLKTTSKLTAAFALAGLSLGTLTSNAVTALGTGFDGTSDGSQMTDITWTTSGLAADPSSTLSPDAGIGLLGGSNTGSHFIGSTNINTGDPSFWSFTLNFTIGALGISLSDIDIEGSNFNSSGSWQQNDRDQKYTVEILNASDTIIGDLVGSTPRFSSNGSTGNSNSGRSYADNYAFASTVSLSANTAYKLKITVDDVTVEGGNFGGINSFSLNGTVVPEPSSALVVVLSGSLLMLRRRR